MAEFWRAISTTCFSLPAFLFLLSTTMSTPPPPSTLLSDDDPLTPLQEDRTTIHPPTTLLDDSRLPTPWQGSSDNERSSNSFDDAQSKHDTNYALLERVKLRKVINATSPRNILYKEMPNTKVKDRVIAAAPAGGRCLITLVKIGKPDKGTCPADIAWCYAIARAIAKVLNSIRTIEWYWGMQLGSLNLNSRWNIILLKFDVHPWYDGQGFVLIPRDISLLESKDALIQHNTAQHDLEPKHRDRQHFKLLHKPKTLYRVIDVSMDPERSWTREDLTTQPVGTEKVRAVWHDPPFTNETMQNIESHLNPFFALYHARYQINEAIRKKKIDESFLDRTPADPLYRTMLLVGKITENLFNHETVPADFMDATDWDVVPPSPTKSRVAGSSKAAVPEPSKPPQHSRNTRSQAASSQARSAVADESEDVFGSRTIASSSQSLAKRARTNPDKGKDTQSATGSQSRHRGAKKRARSPQA
ncbi:hypothetical protein BT96DRAFT_949879 [Gymnopus androsaceus JB14]|uniref:HNH nuclease domain-containing protein n=1 Tax=Gymnopus androsaceus JB14 TaxID=1447944 RepID=A0A6A4GIA3_9AGAR|nr:hypothetical protein BT96DRAFT_949879 [Gymnopus androsaceus JB14]